MFVWQSHFAGSLVASGPTGTAPTIAGLTDGAAVIGDILTAQIAGVPAAGAVQWRLDGADMPGETAATLTVPDIPGGVLTVAVDGLESAAATVLAQILPGLEFDGAVLNPGDTLTVTADGLPATAGEVDLLRNGSPVGLSAGQYTLGTSDLGAFFQARQSDLPSNQSAVALAEATPAPVIDTAPGAAGDSFEGGTHTVDTGDSWLADGSPASISERQYRLVVGGAPGSAQSGAALTIPGASAGQVAQPQISARTQTSTWSEWVDAGAGFTITAGAGWQITDNGDGTITIASAPAAPATPVVTDNGDGTIDISA